MSDKEFKKLVEDVGDLQFDDSGHLMLRELPARVFIAWYQWMKKNPFAEIGKPIEDFDILSVIYDFEVFVKAVQRGKIKENA